MRQLDTRLASSAVHHNGVVYLPVFLLGAGASAEAGLPLSRDLTAGALEALDQTGFSRNELSRALNFVVAAMLHHDSRTGGRPDVLLAIVLAGCSSPGQGADQAPTPVTSAAKSPSPSAAVNPSPTATSTIDCNDPSVPQDVWVQYCAHPEHAEPSPYAPSVDRTWQFVTEFGCKVMFQSINPNSDPLTKRLAHYIGNDKFFVIRAFVDYRHPTNSPNPGIGCGIFNSFFITEDGGEIEPIDAGTLIEIKQDSTDNTDVYNEGVDIYNSFIDNSGAQVYRKGWDYIFFEAAEPFTMVQVYPHGILNAPVFAEQTDQSMPQRTG